MQRSGEEHARYSLRAKLKAEAAKKPLSHLGVSEKNIDEIGLGLHLAHTYSVFLVTLSGK